MQAALKNAMKFYIDGAWVDPVHPKELGVIDPSTEQVFATISAGSAEDANKAVAAAKKAFKTFSQTSKAERLALLKRITEVYTRRAEEFGAIISQEMGAPLPMAISSQAGVGIGHFQQMIKTMEEFEFTRLQGKTLIAYEPVGVVAMITPWNWPMNQIVSKVAPAIAAGCTMVLKPSEIAPLNAILFAEIMHEAGVPAGVFNLVNGDGPSVGQVLAEHVDVDMVSFTGSTRAGVIVAQAAAPTVKRVHQELGGKSPNIILRSADLQTAISAGVSHCFNNSGQSCNAPTRMYVPAEKMDEVIAIAKETAAKTRVGNPKDEGTVIGPVVSEAQFNKIQDLIQAGIDEGAELIAGGTGRPADLNQGYYVRPTIFARVDQDMRISREEIFGPVLSILSYDTIDEVIEKANDTEYGLASYIQGDNAEARAIAPKLRTGSVRINQPAWDGAAPFGGYKQSGNGREYGIFGLTEFLEIKGIQGYEEA